MTRRFKINDPALAGLRFTWDQGHRNLKVILDDKVLASYPDPDALRGRQQLVPLPDGSTLGIGLIENAWNSRGWELEVLRDGAAIPGLNPGSKRITATIIAVVLGVASLLIGLTQNYSVYHRSHEFHALYGAFSVGWILQECFDLSSGNTLPVVCGVLVLLLAAITPRFPLVGFGALAAILAVDAVLDLIYGSVGPAAGKAIWVALFAQAFAQVYAERPPGEDHPVTKLGI
ncbi:MAG: hypothetical protein ACLQGV_06965 [Bryobacteraceae bacterium]